MNNSTSCDQIEHRQLLLVACNAVSIVSMASCLAAIVMWVFFRLYKRFPHRLSLYLLAATLFHAFTQAMEITTLNHDYESKFQSRLCSGAGFLVVYGSWVALLFSTELVFHLSYLVLKQKELWSWKVELFYIFFPLLFPCLFVWIPFMYDTYGLAEAWCWIRKQNEFCELLIAGLIEQFALWYVPYFILAIINFISVTIIVITLCKRTCDKKYQAYEVLQEDQAGNLYKRDYHQYKQVLRETLPLLVFPIALLLLGSCALAGKIHWDVSTQINFALSLTQTAVFSSLGFFVSTLFIIHLVLQGKFSKENIKSTFHQWHRYVTHQKRYDNNFKFGVYYGSTHILPDKYSATDASFEIIRESEVDGIETQ